MGTLPSQKLQYQQNAHSKEVEWFRYFEPANFFRHSVSVPLL
jgi:hypothetical protein